MENQPFFNVARQHESIAVQFRVDDGILRPFAHNNAIEALIE